MHGDVLMGRSVFTAGELRKTAELARDVRENHVRLKEIMRDLEGSLDPELRALKLQQMHAMVGVFVRGYVKLGKLHGRWTQKLLSLRRQTPEQAASQAQQKILIVLADPKSGEHIEAIRQTVEKFQPPYSRLARLLKERHFLRMLAHNNALLQMHTTTKNAVSALS